LICFAGPKHEALAIKDALATFLRAALKLELSAEKTLITHAATHAARFLGYDIVKQSGTRVNKFGGRTLNGKLALRLPASVIEEQSHPYVKKGKVTHRPELAFESDYEIVRRYQWHYAGIVNYYRLAQNVAWLARLHWIMQRSVVRTLANKHKTSANRIWTKYKGTTPTPFGPRRCILASLPRADKPPLLAKFGGIPLRRTEKTSIQDPIPYRFGTTTDVARRLSAGKCELCESTDGVEVHHIRKLADLAKKNREIPLWKRIMIARQRKTLVLCHACHVAIHHPLRPHPK
jgi:hypothetical protein